MHPLRQPTQGNNAGTDPRTRGNFCGPGARIMAVTSGTIRGIFCSVMIATMSSVFSENAIAQLFQHRVVIHPTLQRQLRRRFIFAALVVDQAVQKPDRIMSGQRTKPSSSSLVIQVRTRRTWIPCRNSAECAPCHYCSLSGCSAGYEEYRYLA